MPISRANLFVGPALITRGAGKSYTKDDFTLRIDKTQVPIRVDGLGIVDYRDDDVMVKMNFTPVEYSTASRAILFPYLTMTPGLPIFGAATDTPTTIGDTNAHLHTIVCSAVTKMPSMRLSVKDSMFGDCEITGIRAVNADWATADSLYTLDDDAGSVFDNAAYTTASVKQQQYTGVLTGITGLTTISTADGWWVDFDTEIAFQQDEENGTIRASLVSTSVMARCTPLGKTLADLAAACKVQNVGALRGQSYAASGVDLVITGRAASGAPVITLKGVQAKGFGYKFGSRVLRDGEVGFLATPPVASGVLGALVTMA